MPGVTRGRMDPADLELPFAPLDVDAGAQRGIGVPGVLPYGVGLVSTLTTTAPGDVEVPAIGVMLARQPPRPRTSVSGRRGWRKEEEKPEEERGTYLHPEAWGKPPEAGADYARSTALREESQPPNP